MKKLSRRAFKQATGRLAIVVSVMTGFLGAVYLYSAIDVLDNAEFLPLPFALGIVVTLAIYGIIRLVGWLIAPIFSRHRRRKTHDAIPLSDDKSAPSTQLGGPA